ncbi:MAG: acyltransferase family protein, partial [Bacteroidia bacterium]
IFGLDIKPLNYLGEISYGIYMYHMIVVYAVSFVSMKLLATRLSGLPFHAVYFVLVFGITIAVAAASFYLLESKILKFGRKQINKVPSESVNRLVPDTV